VRGQLLGVAGLSAKEAVRSRLVLVVVLTVVAASVALAWGVSGDGTAPGRLRAFLSWATGFQNLLLALTTAFLGTSLAGAIRDGRMVTFTTAPLARWRLLVAWWLGTAAVVALMVALGHVAIGGLAWGMILTADPRDRDAMADVLRARGVVAPVPADEGALRERMTARFAELAAVGRAPSGATPEEAIDVLVEQERRRRRTALPGRRLSWTFEGVDPAVARDERALLALRFRYVMRTSERTLAPGLGPLGRFTVYPPEGPGFDGPIGQWVGYELHELPIPASLLRGGDTLRVEYQNLEQEEVMVSFPRDGVHLLYPAGGFVPNLIRAALVLLGRLVFLAAFGVAVSAVLVEGRLAALIVFFVLAVGSAHGFLSDALLIPNVYGDSSVDALVKGILEGVLWLLPDLSRADPSGSLAASEEIPAGAAARSLLLDGGLRGAASLAAGAALFARRELGRAVR